MAAENGAGFYGTAASGVPIQHLDYKYVEKCTDAKELEKILKTLRSGEEGHYPELVEFTEKRLEAVNPKSRSLRKEQPVKSYNDLEKTERDEISTDFEEWMNDISQLDAQLKSCPEDEIANNVPPIRSTKTVGASTSGGSQVSSGRDKKTDEKKKGPVAPRSYHDWDKFNPDEEVKVLEEREEAELQQKREKARLNTREENISTDIQTSGKTDEELIFLANREKDKGNDAFRAGDYKESVLFYTRSIELKPTAAAYNNRALAEIKLQKYTNAIEDSSQVVFLEPDNLKAFLRRAIAHKHTGQLTEARKDLDRVLEIEPNNKRAKELMEEVNKELSKCTPPEEADPPRKGGHRLKIVEVDSDDDEDNNEEAASKEGSSQEQKTVNGFGDENVSSSGTTQESVPSDEKSVINDTKDEKACNVDGNTIGKSGIRTGINDAGKSGIENEVDTRLEDEKESQTRNEEKEINNSEGANGVSMEGSNPVTEAPAATVPATAAAATSSSETQVVERPPLDVAERPPMDVAVQSPPPPPPPQRDLPGVVVKAKDQGTKLYKLGRYAEACEKFTEAIDVLQKDKVHFSSALASLLYNRAASFGRIGDSSGCIKDCTSSLDIIPGALKPLLKRAEQQEHVEKYKEAHFDYQAVLRIDPNNQQALHANSRVNSHLFSIYGREWRTKIKDTEPSTVTSQALLDNEAPLPPPSETPAPSTAQPVSSDVKPKASPVPVLSAAERFQQCKEKGNNFVKKGKYEEATRCYAECISIDATEVVSYTNRALCYLRLEKNDLAEKDATSALDLQSDNVKALYRRALARKALARYSEAAKDLLNLIKIDPKNAAGKKELDTVLELCRKERREAQKAQPPSAAEPKKTAYSKAAGKSAKKDETQPPVKSEEPSGLRRRRVVINELNDEEDDSEEEAAPTKKPSSSSAKKPTTQTASPQGKAKNSRDQTQKPNGPTAKGSKQKKIVLNKATPYDFFQAWNTVKRNDPSSYAEILRQVDPKLLPKVLSNKLDADMFRNVVGAILHHLIPNGEDPLAFEILRYVCQAQRFDMSIMFLGRQDIQDLEDVFAKLGESQNLQTSINAKTFSSVKNKYKV